MFQRKGTEMNVWTGTEPRHPEKKKSSWLTIEKPSQWSKTFPSPTRSGMKNRNHQKQKNFETKTQKGCEGEEKGRRLIRISQTLPGNETGSE